MIDGDMQLNLSLSLSDEDTVLAYAQSEKNLYEAIKRQDDLTDYIVNTKYEGLDLIPSFAIDEFDYITNFLQNGRDIF